MNRKESSGRRLGLAATTALLLLVGASGHAAGAPPPVLPDGLGEIVTIFGDAEGLPRSQTITWPRCPEGFVALGGGGDVENVVHERLISSAPTFGDQPLHMQRDGRRPAPDGWRTIVYNAREEPLAHRGAVICAPVDDLQTVVASTSLGPSAAGYARAQCPAGTWAISGGAATKSSSWVDIRYSVPLYGPGGERLYFVEAGRGEPPRGWQAGAVNHAEGLQELQVAAICAPWSGMESVVAAETVGALGFEGARARCGEARPALGGGVDLANVDRLDRSASAPTYPGSGFRLIQQAGAKAEAPEGWQAFVVSHHDGRLDFKVAAICGPEIVPEPEPAGLSNISTRGRVGTGDDVLIGGFIVAGGSLDVSLRGLGPSLDDGSGPMPGRLPDPVLRLHEGATMIAEADDWPPADSAQRAWIELLGMVPPDPLEAVMVRRFTPGGYTAILSGKEHFSRVAGRLVSWHDTGIALFEAFRSEGEGRLSNISTRGRVGRGDDVLIGGFIIEGGRLEVAVRAIAPSLEAGGTAIPGRMDDPYLQIYSGSTVIAENDDWRDDTGQVARIEARGMQPPHPRESVLVRWLEPGPYTAILRGAGETTGIALVEVFDLGGEGRLAGLRMGH